MSWFISFVCTLLSYEERNQELQNEELLLTVECEPPTKATTLTIALSLKIDLMLDLVPLPVQHGRCSRSRCIIVI